jgi:hypothetical protein
VSPFSRMIIFHRQNSTATMTMFRGRREYVLQLFVGAGSLLLHHAYHPGIAGRRFQPKSGYGLISSGST